jgi:hypothetical protein
MPENPYAKYVTQEDSGNPYAKYVADSSVKNPETDKVIMSPEPPTPEWAGKHPNLYGLYGAGRELYRTVGKPAIETAGMIGGGIVGAGSGFLAGAGLGAVPGAAVGAGLGYSGARNLTGAIDSALEIERGNRKATLPGVMKETAKDAVIGSIGAGTPGKSTLQREIMAARRMGSNPATESMLKEAGITLTPGEQTGGKTMAQVESLLEQVPFASDVMQNWREAKQLQPLIAQRNKYIKAGDANTPQAEELGRQIKEVIDSRLAQFDVSKTATANRLRDTLLQRLGSKESYETLSKGAQEIISDKSAQAVAKKNALYSAVDDVMPQGELPFTNYQQEAQRHLDEISGLPNADKELKNILHWGTKVEQNPEEMAFLKSIEQYPPHVQKKLMDEAGISKVTEVEKTWKTMQNHRNQLTDIINGANKPTNNPMLHGQMDDTQRRAKILRDALDRDFEQIAQKQGGEALERYKIAQAFYADEYAPIWKNKIIRSMAHKNPDAIVDVAIKKGSTTEINLVKKAMGEPDFNKTIKPAFTNKLLGAGKDAPFDPKALQRKIADYGDETLLRVYSKGELNTLKYLAKTGKLILDKELPNASLLKTIANKTDNVIVNSILGATERGLGSTVVLHNLTVLDPYLSSVQKTNLKQEFLKRVFKTSEITGAVEPLTMAKNISKYEDILKRYFNSEELNGLRKISEIGKQMSRAQQMASNPSGTAKNVIAWGVANQLLFSPLEPLSRGDVTETGKRVGLGLVTAILAPKTLAKLYLNPKTRQLLIKGMATPKSTQEGMNIARQLSIVLANEQVSDTPEKKEVYAQ